MLVNNYHNISVTNYYTSRQIYSCITPLQVLLRKKELEQVSVINKFLKCFMLQMVCSSKSIQSSSIILHLQTVQTDLVLSLQGILHDLQTMVTALNSHKQRRLMGNTSRSTEPIAQNKIIIPTTVPSVYKPGSNEIMNSRNQSVIHFNNY